MRLLENKVKHVCVLILALIPATGLAAGYGGAEGRNKAGEIIHLGSDSYYELFVQKDESDHEWVEHYDMNIECPGFAQAMQTLAGRRVFSCPANRGFPLSGATYRIATSEEYRPCELEPFFDESPGTVYECIDGCEGERVPPLFYESPWEC
jgi:hypothetical protein